MIKSGLYSVQVHNEAGDLVTVGNFTVVNTVDDDFDIIVGGDGFTLWNGYARAEFGMATVEIGIEKAPNGVIIFDSASIDIAKVKIDDLNDGWPIDVPGFASQKVNHGIAAVHSTDTPVVFTIVREYDIETVE